MSVRLNRGPFATIPTLAEGELGYCTDTFQIFVGTSGGNEEVTGGGVSLPVAVADGGTGATTEADARDNLGLEIGADVQAWDADLDSWAAITRASGFDAFVVTPSSANLAAAVTDETGSGALVFATSPALTTPDIGTPSAGTLTNCTGLPIAGLVASTSTAIGVGSVELGHASDTTISRGAAGFIAVEGNRVPSPASQAQGDLLYRDTTEWARLAKDTNATRYLSNTGSSNNPAWSQVNLANGVTGTLPVGNGGTGATAAIVPVGTVLPWAGAGAVPTGFLACDGSTASQATYAALYAVLGTTWGSDSGGNFTLPDLRRRVPMGSGGTAVSGPANTVGSVGGAETHTLTTGEMPAHTHAQYSLTMIDPVNNAPAGSGRNSPGSVGGTTQSTGGGTAHTNVQPSAVVQFIIKT